VDVCVNVCIYEYACMRVSLLVRPSLSDMRGSVVLVQIAAKSGALRCVSVLPRNAVAAERVGLSHGVADGLIGVFRVV
jgi:hypothetical protein